MINSYKQIRKKNARDYNFQNISIIVDALYKVNSKRVPLEKAPPKIPCN